jgi:hypothetical protein
MFQQTNDLNNKAVEILCKKIIESLRSFLVNFLFHVMIALSIAKGQPRKRQQNSFLHNRTYFPIVWMSSKVRLCQASAKLIFISSLKMFVLFRKRIN